MSQPPTKPTARPRFEAQVHFRTSPEQAQWLRDQTSDRLPATADVLRHLVAEAMATQAAQAAQQG